MTKPELLKIMSYVYAEHGVALTEERILVWWDQFKHIKFDDAKKAARLLASRKSYGPPKAHDFAEALVEVDELGGNRETWGEAWDKFTSIALRFGYYRMEEILPAVVRVSPLAAQAMATGVREYLTSEEQDVPTIRAQFRQRYEALQNRARKDRLMPKDMRPALDGNSQKPKAVGDVVNKLLKQLEGK